MPDLSYGRFLLPTSETVTLARPASSLGSALSVTVDRVNVQAARLDLADEPHGGGIEGQTRTFHLWAAECPTLAPANEFTITRGDGTVWVIKATEYLAHGARYRCSARRRES